MGRRRKSKKVSIVELIFSVAIIIKLQKLSIQNMTIMEIIKIQYLTYQQFQHIREILMLK